MALRQMGIARMGPYRPKFGGAQEGGKVGRPKLLHNGTGHGLTGGGGLNAKGSGGGIKVTQDMKPLQRRLRKSKYQAESTSAQKISERANEQAKAPGSTQMNQHPTGAFMYGHNQWGNINPAGQVDWTYQKPTDPKQVIGFNQVLPWLKRNPQMQAVAQRYLRDRKVAPAAYHDPIYFRNLAKMKLERDFANADALHQRSQLNHDYSWSLKDLGNDYDSNRGDMNASFGAGNIAGSGVAAAQAGQLARSFEDAKARNLAQKNLSDNEISRLMMQAGLSFDVGKNTEEGMARERWLSTHQGQSLPKSKNKTVFTEGGITYRQNEKGIPQTWVNPKPKQKTGQPLHPNAKTYMRNGVVHQIRR